ncbi:glycerate kinase [Arthrobacter sp. StoSoilB19]|jgi:glycerate kinase|uniref:glycerate kinase n=1 Tax=Arthrobacter sp. StoSoilB19 TaxID=2830994 RepID=UPI001CC6D0A3|nr:glycerate kinase [Arthrobacter sp. StoSoilB19]BCW52781.1 glycerate kinase [Arthrobacter sp. StoSoilB19]
MSTSTPSLRALIAPDKFKGSLTAHEVAHALAAGLRSVAGAHRTIQCDLLPLADGGDGSVDAAVSAGFARHTCQVTGPTGQQVQASIAFDGVTAVVEVANTCGISLLPHGTLDPLNSSSRGFGEAIRFALSLAPARIVLALGGSASTDGGTGMLSALGYTFTDTDGHRLEGTGRSLFRIRSVQGSPLPGLVAAELIVASDVSNPLCGPAGAAAVFGPQKGAVPADVASLDAGLVHFVARMEGAGFASARELAGHEGAGSAGGLGFACLLLGARQVSGADFFLDLLDFDGRRDNCDLVITGEGSIDLQTLAGKLPAAVARRSGTRPIIAVAGRSLLPRERWADLSLARVYALADYTSRDSAKDPGLSTALLQQIGRDIGQSIH